MKENAKATGKRSLEELNVLDDFLMNAAASDPEGGAEFCRLILSTLLEREIGRVQVNTQKVIPAYTPGLRGIRMDVEVVETMEPSWNIYDIEPCLYHPQTERLVRRNRFYQGRIDGRYLQSGERDFSHLPNLYVIMILPYDPFGLDSMVYQFQTMSKEFPELDYPDGLRYIYFNTKGTKGGSPKIRQMLDYLQKSTEENVKGETLQKLHRHVEKVKIQPEVREEYMLWEEKIYYERKEAAEEARQEEREKAEKRIKEVERKSKCEAICELLEDYGEIPEEVAEQIGKEKDLDTLKKWLKLAARCGSIPAFREQIEKG